MPKKKSIASRPVAFVHEALIDPENIIAEENECGFNNDGEKFESTLYLVLSEKYLEKFQFATWTRKSKDGKWQSKPWSEMRDRQRVMLKYIESVSTSKRGKQRVLLIESNRRVTIDESNKQWRSGWENNKEKAYAIDFEGLPQIISKCRRKISESIKKSTRTRIIAS